MMFHRLVDCGHTFCHRCLVLWFNVTFRRQQADLPGGLGDLPFMIKYSCPTCRTELAKFPIENYAIRAVIDTVGVTSNAAVTAQMEDAGEERPLERLLEHLV